jgi:hypothetical protein
MARHSLMTKGQLLKIIRIFKFITRRQLEDFFYGKERRSKALEQILPEMERAGSLKSIRHKGSKVYYLPRKNGRMTNYLEHEVACTEILIRLWRCRMEESEIMPERAFRGFYIVPDFGLRFSESRGTMLLGEFCTERNFNHGGVVKSKITRYIKGLSAIEEKASREATVLFVIDAKRQKVAEFIRRMQPVLEDAAISDSAGEGRYPFFFTDYEKFLSIPIGKALTSRIYFWHDGKEWALTNHD